MAANWLPEDTAPKPSAPASEHRFSKHRSTSTRFPSLPTKNQAKIQDVQRHYGPKVSIRFDQPNCIFLLESRSVDLTVAEIMREVSPQSPGGDYFARHARPPS